MDVDLKFKSSRSMCRCLETRQPITTGGAIYGCTCENALLIVSRQLALACRRNRWGWISVRSSDTHS